MFNSTVNETINQSIVEAQEAIASCHYFGISDWQYTSWLGSIFCSLTDLILKLNVLHYFVLIVSLFIIWWFVFGRK